MAKIKAPLFSLDAAGTLDKNITYKGLKQKHIAQKYSQPGSKNPFESSPRQKDQRSIIRLITIHWQCMSSTDKLAWETAAKDARFKGTGYHYFLSKAQQNLTQYLGLVGYWTMNYNVNNKIPDLSGNDNHGTLSPIYPCDCPQPVDSYNKKNGKALSFDGLNDYLNCGVGSSLNFGTGPFTYSAFFKTTAITGDRALVCKYSLGDIWLVAEPSQGRFGYRDNLGNENDQVHKGTNLNNGEWHSIVGSRDGDKNSVYIDGSFVSSQISAVGNTDTPSPLSIGILSPASMAWPHIGLIDNVGIWNRALSDKEIKMIFSI